MPNPAVFVPHFHWDREWYEPFQVFRHRLVAALDTVLETAETDPEFRFTVDGQMAAIEDYLEMRPENRERVAALVAEGRLAVGPWLILLDEFLCSGETIVRNLQMGWAAADELGGAMPIGYLPDMFGHVAQMPQILARAGIEHAALWRGVPGSVEGHAFNWRAPDGSQVRTEFLFDGYDNGLDVLLVPDRIGRALGDYAEMTAERWGGDPVLAMAGTDHNAPDPQLASWLRQAASEGRAITIATLDEYLRKHVRDEVSAVVTGELRSHVRGNILPGVLSVRLGLKQRMAVAERTIDHAERMNALWSRRDDSPFLDLAWHKIIESTAHDSVVGSGTDETCDQVAARLAEAAQTARAVRDAALAKPAELVPSDGHLVANPLPFDRSVLVEVDVIAPPEGTPLVATAADGTTAPVQLISEAPTVLSDERMDASQLERVLRRIHRRELFGRQIDHYELTPGALVFHLAEVPTSGPFDLLILRREVAEAAAQHPGEWRVLTLEEARATALVPVRVPASGLASFRVEPSDRASVAVPTHAPTTATDRTLSNGLVEVAVAADGTLDLTGPDGTVLYGVGRLVDGGDRGDSYNYAPPAHDVLVSEPTEIAVEVVENGPLRARLRVTRGYEWPAALSADRDVRGEQTLPTPVETLVEVRAGEPFVRVSTSFLNQSADHRLRFHVPLPEPVTTSASAGQFAVTERGLTAEGGWGEFPLPTFPAGSFVSAGAATVLLDHSSEYELVGDGSELAVTLLRAIGSISVNIHPLRDEPAASEIPVPGAQDLGMRIENRFAVVPSATGWRGANAVALAEEFRNDVLVTRGTAPTGGQLPPDTAGLRVDGEDVLVSAVRRVTDVEHGPGTEVRLTAMRDTPSTVRLTGTFSEAVTVDLLGRTISRTQVQDELELALGPWEIHTVVLR
ncbi:glycoside hydrolase family 38 C-terminal domain-containing protein [Streptomyces sp. N50]|uniref:glycoside hydrolase family 38 N-terminal domain-containing protein n=1 Tax=Streptomyces sp. N50 TaxID=3081765 RepID=UPI0029623682|nr:glycoside hydrolase family 38 C-terminal domain-containing protein [Streptomyces sp. N50]WOX14952.1 glycoside hydrolase family 38 C-terminal domain-containing protein [Streptomyces sp. N50]